MKSRFFRIMLSGFIIYGGIYLWLDSEKNSQGYYYDPDTGAIHWVNGFYTLITPAICWLGIGFLYKGLRWAAKLPGDGQVPKKRG